MLSQVRVRKTIFSSNMTKRLISYKSINPSSRGGYRGGAPPAPSSLPFMRGKGCRKLSAPPSIKSCIRPCPNPNQCQYSFWTKPDVQIHFVLFSARLDLPFDWDSSLSLCSSNTSNWTWTVTMYAQAYLQNIDKQKETLAVNVFFSDFQMWNIS